MIGSTSIRHRSDTFVSDRCLIDIDPKVIAIKVVVWHVSCSDNEDLLVYNTRQPYADSAAF